MSEAIEFVWRVGVGSIFLYAAHMTWWWRSADRPTLNPPRLNLAIWLTINGVWYIAVGIAAPTGMQLVPWWTGTSRIANTGLAVAIAVVVKVRNGRPNGR
jgi:hypothetical protein